MSGRDNRDKALWDDPFASDPEVTSGAVLLAEDIRRYIERNLLVNRDDFQSGEQFGAKLKGAGYTLTPDPKGARTFERDGNEKVLQIQEDPNDPRGPFYLVEKNSLVFIRLRQQLRIPYYFIGRHNLKISYVYQGLLLGTGPQVDPGYVGQLIIPLHNFTLRDVRVYVKESFVSVDFVRTTRMRFGQGVPGTLDELYQDHGDRKALLERQKVDERVDLRDYLDGLTPQSALYGILEQYEKHEEAFKKHEGDFDKLEDWKYKVEQGFKWVQGVEWIAVIVVVVTFFFGIFGVVWEVRSYHRDLSAELSGYQWQIEALKDQSRERDREARTLEEVRAVVCAHLAGEPAPQTPAVCRTDGPRLEETR